MPSKPLNDQIAAALREQGVELADCQTLAPVIAALPLIREAEAMRDALRPLATVPCERHGNIHCTMLPAESGIKVCAPCTARAVLARLDGAR